MSDSVAVQAEYDRVVDALSYAIGQLAALHAEKGVHLRYPGIAALVDRDELHRGFEAGRRWLADLQARAVSQDVPEYLKKRGQRARQAADLAARSRQAPTHRRAAG